MLFGTNLLIAIAWRPIRLECGHVFCVRCLIKAHRKQLYDCPICRQNNAVGNADANNLDQSLQNFMLLYFPKEIKEKRKENQIEQANINKEQQNMRVNLLGARSNYNHVTHEYSTPQPVRVSHHSSCVLM